MSEKRGSFQRPDHSFFCNLRRWTILAFKLFKRRCLRVNRAANHFSFANLPKTPRGGGSGGTPAGTETSMFATCRHIMPSGLQCQSPAMRGSAFCYHHGRRIPPRGKSPSPGHRVHMPATLDHHGITTASTASSRVLPTTASPPAAPPFFSRASRWPPATPRIALHSLIFFLPSSSVPSSNPAKSSPPSMRSPKNWPSTQTPHRPLPSAPNPDVRKSHSAVSAL